MAALLPAAHGSPPWVTPLAPHLPAVPGLQQDRPGLGTRLSAGGRYGSLAGVMVYFAVDHLFLVCMSQYNSLKYRCGCRHCCP